MMRRTMLPPIRPSPIMPSCIFSPSGDAVAIAHDGGAIVHARKHLGGIARYHKIDDCRPVAPQSLRKRGRQRRWMLDANAATAECLRDIRVVGFCQIGGV